MLTMSKCDLWFTRGWNDMAISWNLSPKFAMIDKLRLTNNARRIYDVLETQPNNFFQSYIVGAEDCFVSNLNGKFPREIPLYSQWNNPEEYDGVGVECEQCGAVCRNAMICTTGLFQYTVVCTTGCLENLYRDLRLVSPLCKLMFEQEESLYTFFNWTKEYSVLEKFSLTFCKE